MATETPLEVQRALATLAKPLRFGDPAALEAAATMKRFKEITCAWCKGTGKKFQSLDMCPTCSGSGRVWVKR